MTDRCDGLSSARARNYSEATCEPSAEETATKEASTRQGTEREAEARRNAYFASGTDEGGRSSRATSDPSALQTSSKYDQRDKNARLAEYYTRFDRPLQDDVAGNALIGAIGAGAIGGVVAASTAGGEAAAGAIGKAAADAAAKSLAKSVVKTVRNDALGGVYDASRRGVALPSSITAPSVPAAASSTSTEVGRSSKRGVSEIVPEPVRSEAPRIPEALPVRIQG